ncbi:hypothetical protein GmHk_05G012186 [Glycine max]|nr:hypothetical protein GmHk_05G012186 [Glycine max]
MGSEIDTKSIEPVRNAVSLFGDKSDQKKYLAARSKSDCEKEFEVLTKELADCKVQLEAKHAAHLQALLKLEHNQKMINELSTLLKKSDIERNKNVNECSECKALKDELESKMKEMADQNLETTAKVRDQLSHVLSALKATQRELINKETELVAARDSELNSLKIAEKEQKEELLQQVKELNEVIYDSKLDAIKSEQEKLAILSEKEEKIELATKATSQVQQQLEDMTKHAEMLQGLQNQPMDKSTRVETLVLSEDSAPKFVNDSGQLSIDMELKERKIMDQYVYIETLEMELSHDIEAQVEIALLKSQFQEHRLAHKNGQVTEVSKVDHSKAEAEERNSENNNDHVTSRNGAQGSVGEVKRFSELALMEKELENASGKISELRARGEQALSKAEFAENAKAALEDKIRRHREHMQRRRAALTALHLGRNLPLNHLVLPHHMEHLEPM